MNERQKSHSLASLFSGLGGSNDNLISSPNAGQYRFKIMERKPVNRIIGTPDYMAPEILKLEDCSSKAIDYWAMGIILYEMLIGIPPFNDTTTEKIHDNILKNQI